MPSTWLLEGVARRFLMGLKPQYAEELVLPPDPEPTFLLGNRWADYGLAIIFAFLFPLLRVVLTRFVYEVGSARSQRQRAISFSTTTHLASPYACSHWASWSSSLERESGKKWQ